MRPFHLALALCWAIGASAQRIPLPAWMAPAFDTAHVVGVDTGSTGPSAIARRNRSVGQVNGVIRFKGEEKEMRFMLWSDSTRAVVELSVPPRMRLTYLADLRAGVIVAAMADARPHASVMDLAPQLYDNRLLRAAPPALPAKRTARTRTFAGLMGTEHRVLHGKDTLRYWTAARGPSPFLDAWHYLPLVEGNPTMLLLQMGVLGDPLPLCLRWNWYRPYSADRTPVPCSITLTEVLPGLRPPPLPDLRALVPQDLRRNEQEPHRGLPERLMPLLKDPLALFDLMNGVEWIAPTYRGSGGGGTGPGELKPKGR